MITTNLSVKSDFSLGESMLKVDDIVNRAKELGLTSVALVDTMTVSGMVEFTSKAKKAGIKPIVGCSLRVYDDPTYRKPTKASGEEEKENRFYTLKIYIRSDVGLRSVVKMLSKANSEEYFYYHSRVGLKDVLELEDVIVTTGDFNNVFHHPDHQNIILELSRKFETFIEIVPIHTPLFDTLNRRALKTLDMLGSVKNIFFTSSYPALYLENSHAESLDVLRAITTNTKVTEPWFPIQYVRDFSLSDPNLLIERVRAFAARCGGIANPHFELTLEASHDYIASKCEFEFKKLPPCLPKMAPDEFAKLVEEVKKGWVARFSRPIFGHKPSEEEIPIYKSRLAYEMGVLKKMGFSGYFLLVQDIVQWAKGNNIMVGPGRGSCFLPDHRVKLSHYGLTKAIQDIKVGDEVIAHDGSFQKVIATLQFERNEEIIDLEFDNGIRISCTRDHKFFTKNRGWVAAEDLTEEDEFEDVEELSRRLKSSSSKEAD